MKITKVLNNNSAVVIDDNNEEAVVIGKAIAFKKKIGDPINPAIIEKKFCLSSPKLNTSFQEILVSLPLEEVTVVAKIIDNMHMKLGKRTSDSIYISLSDHIHYTLKNYAKGIHITNNLLYEIKRFYPDEYKIGCDGLKIIEENTGVILNDDEAGFIAMHIVNCEIEGSIGTDKIAKSTQIIKEVLDIVESFFDKEINEDSLIYFRFINHLKYFSFRITNGTPFKDEDKDKELLNMMKVTYTDSYMCAVNIMEYVKAKYNVVIGNEELLYLVIHIQRAIYNN